MLQFYQLQRDWCRCLRIYKAAFTFSSFPSTSLAVYGIVSQVWLLVLKLHISKLSYTYLLLWSIFCIIS